MNAAVTDTIAANKILKKFQKEVAVCIRQPKDDSSFKFLVYFNSSYANLKMADHKVVL